MREKEIESKLRQATRRRGGLAVKFISPGMNGVPDRLILMPRGRMAFVELKAPGRKPRLLQARRADQLRRLGFRVYFLDRPERIGGLLDEICTP